MGDLRSSILSYFDLNNKNHCKNVIIKRLRSGIVGAVVGSRALLLREINTIIYSRYLKPAFCCFSKKRLAGRKNSGVESLLVLETSANDYFAAKDSAAQILSF